MKAIMMKATFAFAMTGALTVGVAQAQMPKPAANPNANQTLVAPSVQPNPPAPVPQPRPLFKIGNLPVGIWAPVEPPYDVHANRNNSANPLWYAAGSSY